MLIFPVDGTDTLGSGLTGAAEAGVKGDEDAAVLHHPELVLVLGGANNSSRHAATVEAGTGIRDQQGGRRRG